MKKILRIVSLWTAAAGGTVVVMLQKPFEALVSGELAGFVPPSTTLRISYEIGALVLFVLACGFLIGLLHGWTFGAKSAYQLSLAAATPVFLYWLLLTVATWFIAFPGGVVVVAFGWIVLIGVRSGAKLPGACQAL